MKTILPWLVAIAGIAAAAFFFNASKSTSVQVAALQQEIQELQTIKAEHAALKTNLVPADELARLRKDSEDALRLRNEVRQLREAKTQLSQQAQTAQAAAQVAQEQAAQAQAQVTAIGQRVAVAPQLSPEQQAAINARYGLTPPNSATESLNACLNNLRQIDGAKQQWALENRQIVSAIPTAKQISVYLQNNIVPRCPAGGNYSINAVDIPPACTIPGHVLK